MYNFNIEEIKEALQGLSKKDKLEYLSDKETEILSIIDELQTYADKIVELKGELEHAERQALNDEIQNALKASGHDIPWDSNGNITLKLGEATVTIMVNNESINVFFTSESHQLAYREQISKLLPEFKQDGNFFSLNCEEYEVAEKVVKVANELYINN